MKQLRAVALLFWATSTAYAVDYRVAKTGFDTNPGTNADPFLTIQKALDVARAGDTIYVQDGTYSQDLVWNYSGSPGQPITLRNEPGHKPVITVPNKAAAQVAIYIQAIGGQINPIGWLVIEGFEIRDAWYGIKPNSTHDLVVRNNFIHDNRGNIQGSAADISIDSNVIARANFNDSTAGGSSGVNLTGVRITMRNNLFLQNSGTGILISGNPIGSGGQAGPDYFTGRDWVIVNNVFAFSQYNAGITVWQAAATGALIQNNIFIDNVADDPGSGRVNGIDFYNCGAGHLVRNNLFFSTTGRTAIADTSTSFTESGSLTADPRFVSASAADPIGSDYHLQAGSPAIDAGLADRAPILDFSGAPRNGGTAIDLGAYEFAPIGKIGVSCGANAVCESGFCADGVCCDASCERGCQVCSIAAGGIADGTCVPAQRDSVCRVNAGPCDYTEVCDGSSGDCPPDRVAPRGAMGGGAGLRCPQPLLCTGTSPLCGCAIDKECGPGELCLSGLCLPGADAIQNLNAQSCRCTHFSGTESVLLFVALRFRRRFRPAPR